MSKDVSNYISNIEEAKLRSLARTIRSVVKNALPESEEIIWMGIPAYRVHGKPIVEIADYTSHINLYFNKGAKLSSKLLEGSVKGMRHIKIASPADIDTDAITKLLKKAAKLERASGRFHSSGSHPKR